MGYVELPSVRNPDEIYTVDVGDPLQFYDFDNSSEYYVLVNFGWSHSGLLHNPDYLIKPQTTQTVALAAPRDKIAFALSSKLPKAPNPEANPPVFGFMASDVAMSSAPSTFRSVQVSQTPPQQVTEMSQLVSRDQAAVVSIILARLEADLNDRLRITNDGSYRTSRGEATPGVAFRQLAGAGPGVLEFLNLVRGPAANPAHADDLSRKAYVDAAVDLAVHVFPSNSRAASSLPSAYTPWVISLALRSDGAGGWPTANGVVLTYAPGTNTNYVNQLWYDRDSNAVYARTGTSADAWTGWTQQENTAGAAAKVAALITGYNAATLQNNWTNLDSATYHAAGYAKGSGSLVHLRGLVAGGTINSAIFTVPLAYRTSRTQVFAVICSTNVIGRIQINPAGDVVLVAGNTAWVSLDGISYRAV